MSKILIAEDDPASREFLATHLGRDGFDVLCAETGGQALELDYSTWNGQGAVSFGDDAIPYAIYLQTPGLFEPGTAQFEVAPLATPVVTDAPILYDLITQDAPEGTQVDNFSVAEPGGFRWALGPESTLILTTPEPQRLTFNLRFCNPITGQTVEARFNGTVLETLPELPEGAVLERTYTVDTVAGNNTFERGLSG